MGIQCGIKPERNANKVDASSRNAVEANIMTHGGAHSIKVEDIVAE